MNYVYEFTKPALTQFQQLDPWVGKEALDELEKLVADPPRNRLRSPGGFVYDFVRVRNGTTIYVFLTILPDRTRQRLTITNVGLFVRQ